MILPMPASAMDANSGFILNVNVQQEGAAIFYVSNLAGAWPTCAATFARFAISTSTPAGQAMFATILSAVKTHTTVTIHGKGNCDIWGDSESVEYISITS